MNPRQTILSGAVFGFLSVVIGAFAAHGLHLEGYEQGVFETGVRYQFYHALALILVGTLALHQQSWVYAKIAWFWTIGIVLFSGSLYGIVLLEQKKLGMITPLGGICFLVGWLMLIVGLCRSKE